VRHPSRTSPKADDIGTHSSMRRALRPGDQHQPGALLLPPSLEPLASRPSAYRNGRRPGVRAPPDRRRLTPASVQGGSATLTAPTLHGRTAGPRRPLAVGSDRTAAVRPSRHSGPPDSRLPALPLAGSPARQGTDKQQSTIGPEMKSQIARNLGPSVKHRPGARGRRRRWRATLAIR
jgi:hypothetical protein